MQRVDAAGLASGDLSLDVLPDLKVEERKMQKRSSLIFNTADLPKGIDKALEGSKALEGAEGEGEGEGGVVGTSATDGEGEDGGGLAGEDDNDVSASTICWWMALHVTKQCGTVRQLSWQYVLQSSRAWFIAADVKLAGRGA